MNIQAIRSQHWDARPLHERRIITIVTAILTPLLAYFLLWQPAHQAVAKLHETLPQLRIQTEQMHQAAIKVEELRHRPQLAVLDALAVKATIEESATRHQLTLTTAEPQQPNGVRITLSTVSFEKWLIWLRELQQSQHIRAESVAITPLSEPGMVAIRATLTNGQTQ